MSILSIFKKEAATPVPVQTPVYTKLEQAILDDWSANSADWKCSFNGRDHTVAHAINTKRGVRFDVVTKGAGEACTRSEVLVAGLPPFSEGFSHLLGEAILNRAATALRAETDARRKSVLAQLEKAFVS